MRYYFKYDLTSEEAYEITNVILPLNYLDRLDGLRDSLSFEFMLDDDLLPTYYKNKKCQFIIKDDNNNILKDLAMCITDINRDTNTMYEKNNAPIYIYSITLTEPTILIDKCVRTDIAITPNAYITENYQQPYSSLWDAYVKVMTCHNLNTRNEKVYNPYKYVVGLNDTNIDFNIVSVPDGNITANLTINNVLKTSRNQYVNIDGTINVVNEIISLPSVNISDEVLPITKTITGHYTLTNSSLPELDIDENFIQTVHIYYKNNKIKIEQTSTSTQNIMYTNWAYDFTYGTKGTLTLRKMLSNLPCPTLTYVDLSTYTQLTDIFDRVGLVPYLTFATSGENIGKCYIEVFEKEGSYDINEGIKTIEEVSSTEIAKINDECFASVTTQAKNVVCDNTDIVI